MRSPLFWLPVALAACAAPAVSQTLFSDDFNGPLHPNWVTVFPNPFDRVYLGASGYSFQSLGGASVLRLQNVMGNASVRGWSTAAIYPSVGAIRLEARINTMVQSASTGIDELMALWFFDAANPGRFLYITLAAPGWGSGRNVYAYSSLLGGWLTTASLPWTNNTWYRLVIRGSATENLRLSLYDDSGTVELAAVNGGHTLSAFPAGFRAGISQNMGLPGAPYPTDAALDWLRIIRTDGSVSSGTGVLSQPVDASTGTSPVTLTFSQVTTGGTASLTTSAAGPPPPAGFKFGNPPVYYEISTSAAYTGPVSLCIDYTGISFGNESNLRLLHYENGVWVNITTSVNPATNLLCGSTASFSPFTIMEEEALAPAVSNVTLTPNPGPLGSSFALSAAISDAATGGSVLTGAEYAVDAGAFLPMSASDGAFDSPAENAQVLISRTTAGVSAVCVRGRDIAGNVSQPVCTMLAVFDPTGGFVTGGGSIESPAGAWSADPGLVGRASFGFVSRYLPGAQQPSGETQFQFQVANLRFRSTSYDWLVVSGARAQFKGTGALNGSGNYAFLLTAIDGQVNGGGGADRFRIKIWNPVGGGILYDNQLGQSDTGDASTVLAGGSIVIHR